MKFLILSLVLGFLITLVGTPYARRYLLLSGIIGVDQQKQDKPKLPTSGGIPVLFGFLVSVTSYLAFTGFFNLESVDIVATTAALSSVIIIALIGLLDDIHVNLEVIVKEELDIESGDFSLEIHEEMEKVAPHQKLVGNIRKMFGSEKKDSGAMVREGLGQLPKMMFVLPAALPLIAVGAGSWTMYLPFLGKINWGLFYPLVLLPLGLLFVSNVVNMLAGTNGLAASMSAVASLALGLYAFMNNQVGAALIAWSLSVTLIAFLKYNFYPSKILPGDSLTYLAGAAMFSAMVIGNIEKFAVFIFAPWFLEFFLKLRSGFNAHSWGELQDDGSLKTMHEKNYSLTHPLMRKGLDERQITIALTGIETLICLSGLILFGAGYL